MRRLRSTLALAFHALLAPLALIACTEIPPEGVSEEEVRKYQPISELLVRSTAWDHCRLYEAGDLQRRYILAEASRCPQGDVEHRLIAVIQKNITRIETQRDQARHLTCGELVEQRKAPARFDCSVCQEYSRRWEAQRDSAREGLRVLRERIDRGQGCAAAP